VNGQPPAISSTRWGTRTKRTVVLILLVLLGVALWNVLDILPLIIIALLLSYLLWPMVNFFQYRVLRPLPFLGRAGAILATFLVLLSLFILGIVIIIPVVVAQLQELGANLPTFVANIQTEFERALSREISLPLVNNGDPFVPLEALQQITGGANGEEGEAAQTFDLVGVVTQFIGSVGGLTGPALGVLGTFFNTIFNFTLLIVIMFYLMRDGDKFAHQIVDLTPLSYRGDVARLLYELGRVWNAYLRGQLILCLSVGTAVYIAALVLGLPNATILGLLAGILEFIPNLGPLLAMIPAAFLALLSQSSTFPFLEGLPFALTVIVIWILIQNLEALFLVPRIMGSNLNLHPVVVMIAVIAGASLAGPLGIILAAPATATARLIGQYLYGKLFDVDPFPMPKPTGPAVPGFMIRAYDSARERTPEWSARARTGAGDFRRWMGANAPIWAAWTRRRMTALGTLAQRRPAGPPPLLPQGDLLPPDPEVEATIDAVLNEALAPPRDHPHSTQPDDERH